MSKSQTIDEVSPPQHKTSEYLQYGFRKLRTVIHSVISALRHQPDFIICAGLSGVLVGSPISFITGIPLVVLRKDLVSKNGSELEGDVPLSGSYIIIDDFVVSGTAVRNMIAAVSNVSSAKPIAVYLWNTKWYPDNPIDFGMEVIFCT